MAITSTGKLKVNEFKCKECGILIKHYHDASKKVKRHLCWSCQKKLFESEEKNDPLLQK